MKPPKRDLRPDKITISIRLSRTEHAKLIAKCLACEPPTNPTSAARWLITCWVNEGAP